ANPDRGVRGMVVPVERVEVGVVSDLFSDLEDLIAEATVGLAEHGLAASLELDGLAVVARLPAILEPVRRVEPFLHEDGVRVQVGGTNPVQQNDALASSLRELGRLAKPGVRHRELEV